MRFQVKVSELFRVAPRFTIHLIRLMAAANDLNTVIACYLQFPEEASDQPAHNRFSGQRVYLFRLTLGHFHEALRVLKDLGKECADIFDRAAPEVRAKYSHIVTTIAPFERALGRLRAKAVFHYDCSELEDILRKHQEPIEREVILSRKRNETRYSIADDLFTEEIMRAFEIPALETEEGKQAVRDLPDKVVRPQIEIMDLVVGLLATARMMYPDLIKKVGD